MVRATSWVLPSPPMADVDLLPLVKTRLDATVSEVTPDHIKALISRLRPEQLDAD